MLVVLSGSVLAPMGLHWATNGPGSIAAWLVGRRQARSAARAAAEESGAEESDAEPADEQPEGRGESDPA